MLEVLAAQLLPCIGQSETVQRHLRHLVSQGSASLAIRIAGLGINFVATMLLARTMGTAGYGTYSLALAWLNVLSSISVMGLDRLLVRKVAVYKARIRWDEFRGIVSWSGGTALAASVGVLLAGLALLSIGWPGQAMDTMTAAIVFAALPFVVLTRLRQAVLQGLEHVLIAQLPENVFQPMMFLALVLCLLAYSADGMRPPLVAAFFLVSSIVSVAVGLGLLVRRIPLEARAVHPVFLRREWLGAAAPLALLGILNVASNQGETLILGLLDDAADVGRYSVANRLAMFLSFPLLAANAVLPPLIARKHDAGALKEIELLLGRGALLMLAVALPLALVYWFAGHWVLGFFGQDFTGGATSLSILTGGQIVNVSTGSVGILLIMTGHGKEAVTGLAVSAIANLVLAAVLIPSLGIVGAAVASAVSVLIWNVLLCIAVRRHLRILPTALTPLWRGR